MLFRLKAAALHLAVCMLVALLALFLVFFVWYPFPLYKAVGVTHIFLMMLAVDLFLGPILTFIVYKEGKKTLAFDISVIMVLQLAALGYGLWSVGYGRPAWLVFAVDRFDLVRVSDIDQRNLQSTPDEFRQSSLLGPGWAVALPPSDNSGRTKLLFESLQGGSDLAQRPNLYHSLEAEAGTVLARARPMSELQSYNAAGRIKDVLSRWPEADAWLPLKANAESMVVLLSKEKAGVVAIVDLRPW